MSIRTSSSGTPAVLATPTRRRVTLAGHSFDHLYVERPRLWLAVIVLAYVIVAALYAVKTPAWQAPDEPAHYNYIAHIAQTGTLPVLEVGDYDQAQLELLLERAFAPKLPTETLRYESYQPPLYYLSAVPVYWLSDGNLIALRFYSIFLGAVSLVLLYLCLELAFPSKLLISASAVAFAAMLPMHVAMTASVNNDVLAELLIMAVMLALLHWMRGQYYAEGIASGSHQRRQLVLIGVLLGLGMLTKFYAYLLLPLLLLMILLVAWLRPRVDAENAPGRAPFLQALLQCGWVLVPAVLLALPSWLRNMYLYGPFDPLGLTRHDAVVVGQPTTADWIERFGWVSYGERAFGFTFRSFWGVFGWLGVFMDERIYTALLIFSGVIFLGLLWATVRLISGPPDTDLDLFQMTVEALFAIILLLVLAAYIGYNAQYVQHQGRYFFWGLLPISTVVAIGWREVLQPIQGAITGFLVAVLAVSLTITGFLSNDLAKWPILILSLIAAVLLLQPLLLAGTDDRTLGRLPSRVETFVERPLVARVMSWLRVVAWSIPFALLFVLNLSIPFVYIVPQLRP